MEEGGKLVDEEHGIYECPKCKTLGGEYQAGNQTLILCDVCHGEGYVDWIQKVTGKPNRKFIDMLANMKRIGGEMESLYTDFYPTPTPSFECFVVQPNKQLYKVFKRGQWFDLPEQNVYNQISSGTLLKKLFKKF